MKKRQMLTFVLAALLLSLIVLALDMPSARTIEWQSEMELTTNSTLDMSPSIMQADDGTIWIVWVSGRFGNDELYYKTSSNNGSTWSTENRLTNAAGQDDGPSIMQASNGTIWVVWASTRTGDYELFYKTFAGSSWSSDVQFTEELHQDMRASIMQSSDGRIWVVWCSDRTGNYELFYKTYNGSAWSPQETQLTNQTSTDMYPSIAQASNGTIWVVWASKRTGDSELFFKIFNGSWWSSDNRLTYDSPYSDDVPSVVRARDGAVWVVWQSGRPSEDQSELYYKIYDGSAWTSDTQLTSDLANDIAPSVAQIRDKRIWVVWAADRVGDDFDLFYTKSSEIINYDVAIGSVTPSPGKVNQGEIVTINVVAENQGDIDETFTVDCYANETVIGSSTITLANRTSTELIFIWNTTEVSKARYVIKAKASIVPYEIDTFDNVRSHSAVVVTTLGDVNGDIIVNVDDLTALNQSYGSTSVGDPADLNNDSIVNVVDLFLLGKNYT